MEKESEFCSNCKREIPSSNYVIHSVHCHRNIAVCPKCKEPVPRLELQAHDVSEHSSVPCKDCGKMVEASKMPKHLKDSCQSRRVTCAFCELDLVEIERSDHENYCGSRTEKCEECGEFVMIKYRGLHLDSNHGFIKLSDEPGPPGSWEAKNQPSKPIKSILKMPSSRTPFPTYNASRLESRVYNNSSGAESKTHSTVKRENYQPQVNTQPAQTEGKNKVCEETDRQMALRLAREEALNHFASDSCVPTARLAPFYHKISSSESEDDEVVELTAALQSTSPEPKKYLPSSPTSNHDLDQVGFQEVELPCEFCSVLVPASRLVLHQTGCSPESVRYRLPKSDEFAQSSSQGAKPFLKADSPPFTSTDAIQNISMLHNDLSEINEPSPPPRFLRRQGGMGRPENYTNAKQYLIPCDLCGICVPVETFMQHQLACEIHYLPGRQAPRPQTLVMPLSGRTLKATIPAPLLPMDSPPAMKNHFPRDSGNVKNKTKDKERLFGQTDTRRVYSETAISAQTTFNQRSARSSASFSQKSALSDGSSDTKKVATMTNAPSQESVQRDGSDNTRRTVVLTSASGAVPKQKAGRSQGQVPEEVPSSSSSRPRMRPKRRF